MEVAVCGLDIGAKEDYTYNNLQVYSLPALVTVTRTTSYSTLVDEKFSGNEQRRAMWETPRLTFVLNFEKNKAGIAKLNEFFRVVKGKYNAFYFKDNAYNDVLNIATGGSDEWLLCRLDSDDFKVSSMHLGYGTVSLTVTTLLGGN